MNFDKQIEIYSHQGIRLEVGSKYGSVTGPHTHDNEYQIEILLSGKSQSLINKNDIAVMPGYIDLYNPAELHEINYKNTESFIFHLEIGTIKKMYNEIGNFHQHPVFESSLRKKLNLPLFFLQQEIFILKNIINTPKSNSTVKLYLENKVMMLLNFILEEIKPINIASNIQSIKDIKLEKSVNWLRQNFYQDDINLTYLAKLSHLSKFHFIRIFKNIYGRTPYDFLIDLRVKEAMKILKGNKYRNMDEVSVSVGFKNVAQLRYHLKRGSL